jgi:hypothetical protein
MTGTGTVVIVADHGILVPAGGVANPTEATLPRFLKCHQDRLHTVTKRQVGVADNAGGHARLTGMLRVGVGRQPGHEIHLANRSKLDRPSGVIALATFHEYGRYDVVAGRGVGKEVVDKIASRPTP